MCLSFISASLNGLPAVSQRVASRRHLLLLLLCLSIGGLFHSACQVDVTYYPLDMQSCELIFGNWAYFVYQVDMVNASDTINRKNVHRNGEWDIVETSVQKVNGYVLFWIAVLIAVILVLASLYCRCYNS